MLSDGDDDAKPPPSRPQCLLRALFSFLLLLQVGALLIGVPWLFQGEGILDVLLSWQGIGRLRWRNPGLFPAPNPSRRDGGFGLGASGHSALDQLLHRMLLNHPHVHMRLMRREVAQWRKRGGAKTHVFVGHRTGEGGHDERARTAGRHRRYHSLNYANMPLVLAPGLWKRFHNPGTGELQERGHGDGILVGLDSAEALEEVFFQAMTGRSYVTEAALKARDVTPNLHDTYLDYQGIALASIARPDAMYVAKNNNALLRYPAMRRLNRDFHAVVMFRDPLTHAESLRAMHRNTSRCRPTIRS